MKTPLILATIALLLLAACAPAQETAPAKQFTLGIIAPMSGPSAWIGEFVTSSLYLAIEDVNAQGGIDGQPIKVVLEDAGDPAKSSTAANKLIAQDNVDFIYTVTTPVTASASGVAEQNGVPLFGFTAVQTYAKKNTWIFSDLRDIVQECKLLSAVALKNNDKKLAFLGNDADFSEECYQTLEQEFVSAGGQLVAKEMKPSNDPDARTIITKLKSINPDGVVLVCWSPDCNLIYKQMQELQFAPQLYLPIGTALSANPIAVKDLNKDTILAGAYATDQDIDPDAPSPEMAAFVQRLKDKMGPNKIAPHADAAVAFDNMHEIAIAANKCPGIAKDCIRDRLAETDYTGVTGHVAFEGRHYSARPARVVHYENSKWVPVV